MAHPDVGQLLAHPQIRAAIERALASRGVHGDSIIAHLDPREAAMLKMMGGVGTVNPRTGLRQFYDEGGKPSGGTSGDTGATGGTNPGGYGRASDTGGVSGYGVIGNAIGNAITGIGGFLDRASGNFGQGWGSEGVAGGYGGAGNTSGAGYRGDSVGGGGLSGGHSGQNYISQTYGTQSGIPRAPVAAPSLPQAPVISNMPTPPVSLTPMMSSTATTDLAGGERFGALPSWATQPYQIGTAPSSYPTPGVNAGLGAPGYAGNPLPGQPGGALVGGGGLPAAGGGSTLPPGAIGGTSALASKTIPQILAMHLSPGALDRLTTPQNPWLMLPGQQQRQQLSPQGPMLGQTSRPAPRQAVLPPRAPVATAKQPATMTAAAKAAAKAKARTGGKNFG